MAARQTAKRTKVAATTTAAEPTTAKVTIKEKVAGATSGVMAPGAVGKAAREAAHTGVIAPAKPTGWRDPNAKYADDDNSIDARMWRTYTDGIRK